MQMSSLGLQVCDRDPFAKVSRLDACKLIRLHQINI